MAFSRSSRKARRLAREARSSLVEILRRGERAYSAGLTLADNPFARGTEDAEIWQEGFTDARSQEWKILNRPAR
jgi:hypothetical protein